MKRKFKALGLALFATFAMSAVLASGASAEPGPLVLDTQGNVTVDLTGEQIGHHKFVTFFGTITCKKAVFDGTAQSQATTLTVTPTYSECESSGKPVTVTHNGCNYVFTGGNRTAADENHFEGITVSLTCPKGVTGIDIHIYENATKHAEGVNLCTYVVHPFTHKVHNTAKNILTASPDHLELVSNVTSVAIKRTSGTFFTCGTESQTSDYTGTSTVTGFKHNSAHAEADRLGITLTDLTP